MSEVNKIVVLLKYMSVGNKNATQHFMLHDAYKLNKLLKKLTLIKSLNT